MDDEHEAEHRRINAIPPDERVLALRAHLRLEHEALKIQVESSPLENLTVLHGGHHPDMVDVTADLERQAWVSAKETLAKAEDAYVGALVERAPYKVGDVVVWLGGRVEILSVTTDAGTDYKTVNYQLGHRNEGRTDTITGWAVDTELKPFVVAAAVPPAEEEP